MSNHLTRKTAKHYGAGWVRGHDTAPLTNAPWHYDKVRSLCGFPVGQPGVGLEAGCGDGRDAVRLANANPKSRIVAIDLSTSVQIASARLRGLAIKNVHVVQADLANIPLATKSCDWAYSFGVLHHMLRPPDGLREIARVLKTGAPVILYLYSDLRERPVLRVLLLPVTAVRQITRRLPLPLLRVFCAALTPMIFACLTVPSRMLKRFGGRGIAMKFPYHDARDRRQVYGGLYDRFGAQIEHRFNAQTIAALYRQCGFRMDGIGQVPGWRGWVSWGRSTSV